LASITVIYNLAEGLISLYFGMRDESLSLFGFGVDSFVEVVSGIGILHLVSRIRANGNESRNEFENTALIITGVSFYVLSGGLIITAVYNILTNHHPDATFWGTVISVVSIFSMTILVYFKLLVGNALNSKAIIADAHCTQTCLYLSVVLLVASLGYSITGFGFIDSIGALGISYFSFNEGKEAFEKAKTGKNCNCNHD
jgi:divalent metal cation (Fe/Co/Zn/Cd) transporter